MSAQLLNNVPRIALDQIDVVDRIREDLGDIEELAASIASEGLMQPIVLEQVESNGKQYRLLAGGRRYTAFKLLSAQHADFEFDAIPYVLVNQLTPLQRIRLELEENMRRKSMTWQEQVVGIYKYHHASRKAAILEKSQWTQEMTGELLNLGQASVSLALKVYDGLKDPAVAGAESMQEALKVMLAQAQDAAAKEQMRRIELRKAEAAKATPSVVASAPAMGTIVTTGPLLDGTSHAKPKFTLDQIAAFYRKGDCLNVLPTLVGQGINHIITDPPYGIDMSVVSNSDRVAETHDVGDNLKLLPEFLRLSFDVVAEDGFLAMWYDLDHHEKIAQWAKSIGWRVCRWPVVWCKTSSCINQAAQYNVTKATEVCYVMRKSEKSTIKKKQPHNYILAGSASTQSHPFVKPASVWNYLIETLTLPEQLVLDPFAGEGSALAAFFNAGRQPLGIECDEKHINNGLNYIQSQIGGASAVDTDELMDTPVL